MKGIVVIMLLLAGFATGCGKGETAVTDTAVTETIVPDETVPGSEPVEPATSASEAPSIEEQNTTASGGSTEAGAAQN